MTQSGDSSSPRGFPPGGSHADRSKSVILQLPGYHRAVAAFATPLGNPAEFPADILTVVQAIGDWSLRARRALESLRRPSVFRQVLHFGSVVFDTHRLRALADTRAIDDWLASPSASPDARAAFESWRQAFALRYQAVRTLSADILLSGDLTLFDQNPLLDLAANVRRLGWVFGGTTYKWGGPGVMLGMMLLALREHCFLSRLISGEVAAHGLSFHRQGDQRRLQRVNSAAGATLITRRHAASLRRTFHMLGRHGVHGAAADRIVIEALRQAHAAAGKPWKGLIKLRQLIEHARVDPRRADFLELFRAATAAPVLYTHTPGQEWVVRDFELGRKLLQMDGKIPEGSDAATLQQGRVSIMPGIAGATPGATEFARRYFGPVRSFLHSMVTADGADHQRMRKRFLPYFSRRAVFDQAELVEKTVAGLLDQAESVARANDGAFDFKKDFAFGFPIQIICAIVGIRGEDIARIQRWTGESTRAMDTEAGVSLSTASLGERSAEQQRAFFGGLLSQARAGRPASELVRTLAIDETLSEAERIANLSVIIFAGFETTTGLLCKGISELLQRPRQWAFLRQHLVDGPPLEVDGQLVPDVDLRWYRWAAGDTRESNPTRRQAIAALLAKSPPLRARLQSIESQEMLLDDAVEEMLRWCAPGSIIPLTASQDLEVPVTCPMVVRGKQLQTGDPLKISRGETATVAVDELNRRCPFGGGTFDPAAEGTFDISRTQNYKHLSFGVKHMCIGAALAKENAKRALEGVLRRFPDLTLNGTPIPQDMELFHGLESLPVRSPALRVRAG